MTAAATIHKVRDAMTHQPFTIGPDTSVETAKLLLDREKIHHLPIVDKKGILVGIISSSDILLLMDWATRFNQPRAIKISNWLMKSQVANDISTKNVMAVFPDDSLLNCYEVFKHKEVRALPVISSEGFLIGIITPLDIVRCFLKK